MAVRSDRDNFIKKANDIHNNKYVYDDVVYVNNRTPVKIYCPIHGWFEQTPHEHLSGCGCPQCALISRGLKRRKGNEEFIQQAIEVHGDKYDYSKSEYTGANKKVCITCPEHGDFWMAPINHIKGQGCPMCRNKKISQGNLKSAEQFIIDAKEKHKDENYDYSEVDYKGSKIPIILTCPEGHRFSIRPNDFLMGHGCPICASRFGISEGIVVNELKKHYNVLTQYKPDWLQSRTSFQSIDAFLPDYNIGVEYQGGQHFYSKIRFGGDEKFAVITERDKRKYTKCLEHGVKLFYISFETQVPDTYIDTIYRNTNDLILAINQYISENNPIKLNESDIKHIVNGVVESVLIDYLYEN